MRRYHIFGFVLLLTLSSCLTVIHSLITPDNIITDNRIEGLWNGSDSKTILVRKFMSSKFRTVFTNPIAEDWKYTREDSIFLIKSYVISFREKNLDYTWLAGVVKIKDQYYLNLKPQECLNDKGKDEYDLGMFTSSIAKLEWKNNNSLTLHFLNGDYIKQIILNGKAQIKYEYDHLFETFVITASPKELEQFLGKYGDNDNLFRDGNTIMLTRKM